MTIYEIEKMFNNFQKYYLTLKKPPLNDSRRRSTKKQRQALLRVLLKRRARGASRESTKLYLKNWLKKFSRN